MNVRRPSKSFFYSIVVTTYLSSCSYNKVAEITPTPLETGCDTVSVTYSKTIKPILAVHCYTCHSDTSTNPAKNSGVLLSDFNVLKNLTIQTSFANPLYNTLQARIRHVEMPGMPLSRPMLSECNIRQIEIWIKAGAPHN